MRSAISHEITLIGDTRLASIKIVLELLQHGWCAVDCRQKEGTAHRGCDYVPIAMTQQKRI